MLEIAQSNTPYDEHFQILIERINSLGRDELISLLDQAVAAWRCNKMLPSQLFSIIASVDKKLGQTPQSNRNEQPVLVCSFSPVVTMGALLSKVFLKSRTFNVRLINITYPTDLDLLMKTIVSCASPAVVFSFSLFHFIEMVSDRLQDLLSLNTTYYAGGVAFDLKPEMRQLLPGVLFPSDLPNLVGLLENQVNEY
ncbi:hypothetical protein [Dehalogenimonas alkenigignens]|uniref:hypothetical protein n=1 Tax=Dehalogenimonas alkenigignens TaxID=1217799 RepID=UPI000D56BFF5|nr:hypothetical protein [Dehalogenimonas alkenigignens]PVV82610.1 hypothetical protein DD509_08275 [Dehalogenimonas alkenigignens]